ncbi:MAG: hypothetical protein E6R13_03585 [Spirochaetes bacterium]|nr:MAG: hypothetical protein E6R13_03585 [Spirochaetota bacterium]
MKRYVNYLFVPLFIGAIFLASYSKRRHDKDINNKLLISLNDSISKDSIVISVGVQGQEDTLIYNDGIYIRYPKKLKIQVSVSKSPTLRRKVIVFDTVYNVNADKSI